MMVTGLISFQRLYVATLILMVIYCVVAGTVAYVNPSYFFALTASHTGAFNTHLVRDVGAAFLTSGIILTLGLMVAKWRTPCAISGALFLVLHGFIHWYELLIEESLNIKHVVTEVLTVLVPAIIIGIIVCYRLYRNR